MLEVEAEAEAEAEVEVEAFEWDAPCALSIQLRAVFLRPAPAASRPSNAC